MPKSKKSASRSGMTVVSIMKSSGRRKSRRTHLQVQLDHICMKRVNEAVAKVIVPKVTLKHRYHIKSSYRDEHGVGAFVDPNRRLDVARQ